MQSENTSHRLIRDCEVIALHLFIFSNDEFDFILDTEVTRENKKKQLHKQSWDQDTPQTSHGAVQIKSSRVVTGE